MTATSPPPRTKGWAFEARVVFSSEGKLQSRPQSTVDGVGLVFARTSKERATIVKEMLAGNQSEEMTELYDAGKEVDFQKARARLEELTGLGEERSR